MESQPRNPEFRNKPENFHPWNPDDLDLHCFKKKDQSGFSKTKVKQAKSNI